MSGRAFLAAYAVCAVVLLIVVLMPGIWAWLGTTDRTSGQVTVVAALLGSLGAFVSAAFGVWLFGRQAREREETKQADEAAQRVKEAAARETDVRNMATALRAEIWVSLERLERIFLDQAVRDVLPNYASMIEAAPKEDRNGGMPVSIGLPANAMFNACRDRLVEIQNARVLRAVVQYYQNDAYLTEYLNETAAGRFADLSVERRKAAVLHFYTLGQDTTISGVLAVAYLDDFLESDGALAEAADKRDGPLGKLLVEEVLDEIEKKYDGTALYEIVQPSHIASRDKIYRACLGLGA